MHVVEDDAFVGRERELARIDALFASGERLVSIVGGPGVGKTRLAARHAQSVAQKRTVVARVDLADTRSEEEIALAFANALGLRDSSPALGHVEAGELIERVDAALETGEVDLVLVDDAESAASSLATCVARWLAEAPRVRFLVASRQALSLRAEQLIELGPLSIPDDDSLEALERSEAAQLLFVRSDRVRLDAQTAPVVGRLVRSLDGNPLAIELAAARLRSLGLRDVTERIASGIDLLDRAPRDARWRHASLRRAIGVSWDLSTDEERALLARCAVFRGWFDVGAVEAVAGDAMESPLDALHGARERSLVSMREVGGRSRYALSAPVRAFAEEMLEASGAAEDARARHASWLAERAREAAERWRLSAHEDDLAFLREHQADLAAALAIADAHLRARLLLAFDVVLAHREKPAAHVALLREPLFAIEPSALQVRLAIALALALERAGDARAGLDTLDAARAIAVAEPLAAELEVTAAQLSQTSGALDAARASFERAIALAGEGALLVRALRGLGLVAHARGDLDEAERRYREALHRASELPLLEARLFSDMGSVRLAQHRLEEARERFERALERSASAPNPVTIGLTEGNLAILAQEEGRLDDAAAAFARAIDELSRSGHRLYEAHLALYAGFVEHERGELARAVSLYERALGALLTMGDARMAGLGLAGLGAAEAQRGRTRAAEDAFARAEKQLEGIGDAGLSLALALHRGHLSLSEAEADPDRSVALREEVSRVIASADPDVLGRSDDARIGLRILRQRLEARTLSVARDGGLIRLPDGEVIDLSRRDVLKRIVLALARARIERPGQAVSVETLVAEGWPDERILWGPALNRLKVALSTLRKLGLRDALERHEQGYLLDPGVSATWMDG